MATMFTLQASIDQRHGSYTVKPVCLWTDSVVSAKT